MRAPRAGSRYFSYRLDINGEAEKALPPGMLATADAVADNYIQRVNLDTRDPTTVGGRGVIVSYHSGGLNRFGPAVFVANGGHVYQFAWDAGVFECTPAPGFTGPGVYGYVSRLGAVPELVAAWPLTVPAAGGIPLSPAPAGEKGEVMSTEENKALIRRVTDEVYSQGKLDAVDRYYAPDWVLHDAPPNAGGDREALKEVLGVIRGGFPDVRASIEVILAEGDLVASRTTAEGTHTREYFGIAPPGHRATA